MLSTYEGGMAKLKFTDRRRIEQHVLFLRTTSKIVRAHLARQHQLYGQASGTHVGARRFFTKSMS
jgi:hypothetical protein